MSIVKRYAQVGTSGRARMYYEAIATTYKDSAVLVGFCDQSHLDRVFKKQVGISPEQYANSAILSNAGT